MPTNTTMQLAPAEVERLEQYAKAHATTVEKAASHLAAEAVRRRYLLPRQPAVVMPLRKQKQ